MAFAEDGDVQKGAESVDFDASAEMVSDRLEESSVAYLCSLISALWLMVCEAIFSGESKGETVVENEDRLQSRRRAVI